MRPELTADERSLLDFASWQYRFPGKQEADLRELFGFGASTYWRKVNDLLDRPAALAYDPVTVNRLLRVREDRRAARSVDLLKAG
jgi:hypothetical protein